MDVGGLFFEFEAGRTASIIHADILLSWAGDASMTLGEVKCVADNVLVQVTKVEEEAARGKIQRVRGKRREVRGKRSELRGKM